MLIWLRFLAIGWGVPLFAYVAVQSCALFSVRATRRLAVGTPLPFMLFVVGHMAWAYQHESNLWPMTMLMVTPGALLAVGVLWAFAAVSERHCQSLLVLTCAFTAVILVAALSDHGTDILWTGAHGLRVAGLLVTLGLAMQVCTQLWRRRRTKR